MKDGFQVFENREIFLSDAPLSDGPIEVIERMISLKVALSSEAPGKPNEFTLRARTVASQVMKEAKTVFGLPSNSESFR